jgi:hypothetical protein
LCVNCGLTREGCEGVGVAAGGNLYFRVWE